MSKRREILPIEQPVPITYGGRPWFRIRRISFIPDDWRNFDEAMRIACPYVRFVPSLSGREAREPAPPQVKPTATISELVQPNGDLPWDVNMVFDPGWPLIFEPPGTPKELNNGALSTTWSYRYPMPLPMVHIRSPAIYRPGEEHGLESYDDGRFDLSIVPNDEHHVAFFRALFALLGKLSSNRHQTRVAIPEGYSYKPTVTSDLWLGHEAIRWALERPNRVFDWTKFSKRDEPLDGAGIRPIEEKWRDKLPPKGWVKAAQERTTYHK